MPENAVPTAARQNVQAPLGRNFTLLWSGETVSLLGSATTSVLLPLLAVSVFHAGPGWMGLLTAAAWLPWLIIGLPAGAWLDRLPPRRVMIIADLVAAAALITVPLAAWSGWLSLSQLIIVALLGGVATVFFRTAYVKLLPLIVADLGLERANARLFGTESAAQVAGPGLAGVILQLVSAASGLLLDVVGFAASALCLSRITLATVPPSLPPVNPLRARIAEGLRTVLGDHHLRALMIIGGLSNFGLTGYGSLLVLYLVRRLGLSPTELSVVLMIGSLGGVLGTVLAPPLARRIGTGRASTVLFVCAGPSALLIALPGNHAQVALTALGLFLVGLAVVGGNVIRGSWRQRYVPAELMGRVVTSSQLLNYGTMPLAGLTAGLLGTQLGVRPTMLIMAGIHLIACLSILLTRFGRGRELPVRTDG